MTPAEYAQELREVTDRIDQAVGEVIELTIRHCPLGRKYDRTAESERKARTDLVHGRDWLLDALKWLPEEEDG